MEKHGHCSCGCKKDSTDKIHSENKSQSCGCGHCHTHHGKDHKSKIKLFAPEIVTAIILAVELIFFRNSPLISLIIGLTAILPVGIPILKETFKEWFHGDFFNEFTLMTVACVGAFLIGEFPEGVAILLFYSFGEKLEDIVSGDVKGQIKKLLNKMPKKAVVLEGEIRKEFFPDNVRPGQILLVKPGESVPLDGILLSEGGIDFNTSAVTGESLPRNFNENEEILSGMIPMNKEVRVKVTKEFADSSMSRIMAMIEDASAHRAPSEKILRKITRWYTPVVFGAALLLTIIPWIISLCNSSFIFEWNIWLERSLVFLVCSCPCALIVSIPLTYFSSIGIASKKGILFKGHDSLDTVRNVDTFLFDKTGTITTGKFHIENIEIYSEIPEDKVLSIVASIELSSNHPLANVIVEEARRRNLNLINIRDVKTENHGLRAVVEDQEYLVGSKSFMIRNYINIKENNDGSTSMYISAEGCLLARISLSDTLKESSQDIVELLHNDGIKEIGIISGDSKDAVEKVRSNIGADYAEGGLFPADKINIINRQKKQGKKVAFAGDGINDAPALAGADIGIAMGKIGSDMAIESAGMIIAGDDLRKIHEGLNISRRVKSVIIENVTFAFGVKITVMTLGAFGIATLWAAVFADTGVTLVTVIWTLLRLKIWELKK